MLMYNLIEYSDNYSKTFWILWQFCSDELAINLAHSKTADFTEANAITNSFKIKEKMTSKTGEFN